MPVIGYFPGGSGSGAGIALDPVTDIQTMAAHEKVYIKWTDPIDLSLENLMLAEWDGTLLVRKAGSMPVSRRDGVIVLDSKVRNAYQNTYFVDSGLTDGTAYYYKLFPYTKTGTYTDAPECEFTATPNAVAVGNVSNISTSAAGNGKLSIQWTDPAASVVSNGVTLASWASTIVVVKAGSYATLPTDPDAAFTYTSTTRNAHASTPLTAAGLTNGTTYYVSLFPMSTDGKANTDTANRKTGVPNRITVASVPSQSGTLTYNSNVQSPTWSGYDTGKMTVSGQTSGTNAGSYTAKFTLDDDYCWGDGSTDVKNVTWNIGRAETAVPTTTSSFIYDGTEKSPVFTGYNSDKMTIGGTYQASNAGSYTISFSPNGNYKWPDGTTAAKNVNWSIAVRSVAVPTANTKNFTYDGSAQGPSFTYESAYVTIDGDSGTKTNAGNYTVSFALKSTENTKWSDNTTADKSISWSIAVRSITAPAANKTSFTYTGSGQAPTFTYDSVYSTASGDLTAKTNAGSYTAMFELKDKVNTKWADNTTADKTIAWSIGRAFMAVPTTSSTFTYDGTEKTPVWSGYDSTKMTMSGTSSATNAGSYMTTFTPKSNYAWSDGTTVPTTAAKIVAWSIGRAETAVPTTASTFTYDGTEKAPIFTGYDSNKITISGTYNATNAGSYTASFTPTSNYKWPDGTTSKKLVVWSIAVRSVAVPTANKTSFTYDGSSQGPTFTYDSTYATASGDTSAKTNAGSYTATFALKDAINTKWSDNTTAGKSIAWSIAVRLITVPSADNTNFTYSGSAQGPTFTYDSTYSTINGNSGKLINAGDYIATFVLKDAVNTKWSDNTTGNKSIVWFISKAAGSLTLSASSVTLGNFKASSTRSVTVTRLGDGAITATSSNTSVATVSVSGTTVKISSVNKTNGSATITIKVAAGTNYTAPASKTVIVTAQFIGALNDTSWAKIREVSDASQGANIWSVGDCKEIQVKGTVGTVSINQMLCVFILGFDHNSSIEGIGIHFGTFKTALTNGINVCLDDGRSSTIIDGTKAFNMNHWGDPTTDTTYGGWKGCDLRYDILGSTRNAPSGYGSKPTASRVGYDAPTNTATSPVPNTLMAALPSDLRAVMKPITKYSNNTGNGAGDADAVTSSVDYLPLLGEYEVVGNYTYESNVYEKNYQRIYSYYSAGNSKYKYKHNNTSSAKRWCLRSFSNSSKSLICCIDMGSASVSGSTTPSGLSPCFMV